MPARTTPSRRPAGSAPKGRSGSTAAGKRPAARAPARNGNRKPPARKPAQGPGAAAGIWRAASGTWGLLARGAGGLARSVAKPEEAESLAPEHRRDGVGLAVLGLAIVLGAAVWSDGIGPVGRGIADAVSWIVGSLVLVLPVVLFLAALRLLRRGPRPEARGRLTIGWLCTVGIRAGVVTSRQADGVFRRVMREAGVPVLLRWLMWAGVRWGALADPERRPGWVLSAPGVLVISLLAAPLVLPPSLLVVPGLLVYAAAERLVSGESGVRPWSRPPRG